MLAPVGKGYMKQCVVNETLSSFYHQSAAPLAKIHLVAFEFPLKLEIDHGTLTDVALHCKEEFSSIIWTGW